MEITLQGFMATREVYLNDMRLDLKKSQEIVNHSPDGFNWGYEGSGPAQLALALCLELHGSPHGYQQFKRLYIATLPQTDFRVTIDITDWYLNTYSPVPWTRLKSGTIVANFSSPHTFEFEDGTILSACTDERAGRKTIHFREETILFLGSGAGERHYISITPEMTTIGTEDMFEIYGLFASHIVIVPRPVLEAYKEQESEESYLASPFVTGRLVDRVKKILSCSQFCK